MGLHDYKINKLSPRLLPAHESEVVEPFWDIIKSLVLPLLLALESDLKTYALPMLLLAITPIEVLMSGQSFSSAGLSILLQLSTIIAII